MSACNVICLNGTSCQYCTVPYVIPTLKFGTVPYVIPILKYGTVFCIYVAVTGALKNASSESDHRLKSLVYGMCTKLLQRVVHFRLLLHGLVSDVSTIHDWSSSVMAESS